jgi:hypothetical protein
MAKKKTVKKASGANPNRVPRKEPYTAERMSKILERIREQAARISGLARAIEDAKIDSLVIDGHQMLFRGLNQIDNFIDNASRSVREAKTGKDNL